MTLGLFRKPHWSHEVVEAQGASKSPSHRAKTCFPSGNKWQEWMLSNSRKITIMHKALVPMIPNGPEACSVRTPVIFVLLCDLASKNLSGRIDVTNVDAQPS
jgi:hypothetical protein